jgi:hypothetical protein
MTTAKPSTDDDPIESRRTAAYKGEAAIANGCNIIASPFRKDTGNGHVATG